MAHLERAGYEILERNFRCARGELDVVARHRDALVFCEVKTRVAGSASGPATPLEAVTRAKQLRQRRLAAEWLRSGVSRGRYQPDLRFDVIGVTMGPGGEMRTLEHLEGAY